MIIQGMAFKKMLVAIDTVLYLSKMFAHSKD